MLSRARVCRRFAPRTRAQKRNRSRRTSRPGPGIVVPATVGPEIHGRELPDLAPITNTRLKAARLLLRADFQPVLEENDAGIDDYLLGRRHHAQETLHLLFGAKTHHALDSRAVVPAAVEDDDFPGSREVRNVSLYVHLDFFAVGRRRQRNDAKHARTHALGDRFDGTALAGTIAPFEHDTDLRPLCLTHSWARSPGWPPPGGTTCRANSPSDASPSRPRRFVPAGQLPRRTGRG